MAEAVALSRKERDRFHVAAFLIAAWLADVALESVSAYAGRKNPRERAVQTGYSFQALLKCFGPVVEKKPHLVLQHLHRFAEYDDVQAEILRRTIIPLSLEHECLGDFVGPGTCKVATTPRAALALLRRTLERWCEWIDALTHFQTHACWCLAPLQFDPDPEMRELAVLGTSQRLFGKLSAPSREWWQRHHNEAADRFKSSPKWRAVGKSMAAPEPRRWTYRELDELVIWFWPLLKRYNWTYRDLMSVIRTIHSRPAVYPCDREQDFAAYCSNILGLKKRGRGKTAKNGRPVGCEVALRLCTHP